MQNEANLQALNKAQQKLTADQNQLLMAGGKLEQQAQVRILGLGTWLTRTRSFHLLNIHTGFEQ